VSIGSGVKPVSSNLFSSRPQAIFASAMALLIMCLVATYLSFSYLREASDWVIRTQEVRGALGDLEADINHAARARLSYLIGGSDTDLEDYKKVFPKISTELAEVARLTQDSAAQTERSKQLEILITDRIHAWEFSIAQKQEGKPVDLRALLSQNLELSARNAAVTEAIRAEEGRLLDPRIRTARRSFAITRLIVGVTFALAVVFLSIYYLLLNRQLRARESAERQAREAYDREAASRREAEDFSLFIGAVKDYAIFTLDASGHIKSWNRGAQRLKGYAASEIIGQHFSVFYPEVDIQNAKPRRELEIAEREGRVEDEGWRVRQDGSRFWANVVITATRNQSGHLVGFTKVTRDFTERMRTQQELRRSNAELATQVAETKAAEERLAAKVLFAGFPCTY
jgi:PAS domain S-box-containing protein